MLSTFQKEGLFFFIYPHDYQSLFSTGLSEDAHRIVTKEYNIWADKNQS